MNFIFLCNAQGSLIFGVTFFSNVQKQCKNFSLLNSKFQFNWFLVNSDGLVIIQLANFVCDCFDIHGK